MALAGALLSMSAGVLFADVITAYRARRDGPERGRTPARDRVPMIRSVGLSSASDLD